MGNHWFIEIIYTTKKVYKKLSANEFKTNSILDLRKESVGGIKLVHIKFRQRVKRIILVPIIHKRIKGNSHIMSDEW